MLVELMDPPSVKVGDYRNVAYVALRAARVRYGHECVDEETFITLAQALPDDLNGPYAETIIRSRRELDLLLNGYGLAIIEHPNGKIFLQKNDEWPI